MAAPLLRLSEISKTFGAVHALKGVSLELLPGEVHALVGENGAGKSTLVQVITGAQSPDSGAIEIAGHPVTHLTPARSRQLGVVCVYQRPALFADLTVSENVALRLGQTSALRRIDWRGQREQARQLLEQIGAQIGPENLVRELSMPEQQLVEIACALGANARVVILDEPTASLTQREQHLLFRVVRRLREQGAGIIYVSHRLEEIFALADRVTVLRDGAAVATAAADQLNETQLIRLMVGRDVAVQSFAERRISDKTILSLRKLGCEASGIADVSFDLHAGEILGLAGLVGAGRTELARTLFGLTPADAGQILLEGKPVSLDSPQSAVVHGIAYVPEDRARHGVVAEFSVAQNISLASLTRLFPGGWVRSEPERKIAAEQIQALDVRPALPDELVSSLSGGNQQKVSLARWLAMNPRVLILDEPTQGVDVGAKSEIHRMIREWVQPETKDDSLARELCAGERPEGVYHVDALRAEHGSRSGAANGLAVLLISSDLPELLALSDRIGVMRAGRLVAMLPGHSAPHDVMAAAFGQSGS